MYLVIHKTEIWKVYHRCSLPKVLWETHLHKSDEPKELHQEISHKYQNDRTLNAHCSSTIPSLDHLGSLERSKRGLLDICLAGLTWYGLKSAATIARFGKGLIQKLEIN